MPYICNSIPLCSKTSLRLTAILMPRFDVFYSLFGGKDINNVSNFIHSL